MSTFRKTAREAVIFMLLGVAVGVLVAFVLLERRSTRDVKKDAANAVYAYEAPPLPPGEPVVQVPLTNGVLLFVTDCNRAHPWVVSSQPPGGTPTKTVPVQAGSTNGSDCVYFTNEFLELEQKYGGRLVSVPLGDENQVAIEKDYWLAYTKSKNEHLAQNALESVFLSLWGFPAGIIVWLFYRLIRFAVKG